MVTNTDYWPTINNKNSNLLTDTTEDFVHKCHSVCVHWFVGSRYRPREEVCESYVKFKMEINDEDVIVHVSFDEYLKLASTKSYPYPVVCNLQVLLILFVFRAQICINTCSLTDTPSLNLLHRKVATIFIHPRWVVIWYTSSKKFYIIHIIVI